MKIHAVRLLSMLLAVLMLVSCFAACGNGDGDETEADTGDQGASTEGSTEKDLAQEAIDALGKVDFDDRLFAVCYSPGFESEIKGENGIVDESGGADQVINDAVYERNVLLEELCNLEFDYFPSDNVKSSLDNEAAAGTGDFFLAEDTLFNTASYASSGVLYDYNALGVDLDHPWWDSGTTEFVLNDKVFFMNGAVNFADDNVTYVLIFNKELREKNNIANPYDTVKAWEWTLDYFNTIIQGVSQDNGNGTWGSEDTYGFLTTWEYGNTFFLGCDLRYIINDKNTGMPYLFLNDKSKMEKATQVLELAQEIYHDNNASFMSPGGEEALGLTAFKEKRGMFYGEVASYLRQLSKDVDFDYGVVPVPKYDKAQEFYRTWTHNNSSTLSVTSAVRESDAEVIGKIISAYAALSYQKVKPAFYDTTLASKSLRDGESAEMLDIIFSNRVYDMAFCYVNSFGNYFDLFKTSVNTNTDNFTSQYQSVSKGFDRKVSKFMRDLGE